MNANDFITVEEKERRERLKNLRASLRAEMDEHGQPQIRKLVTIKFPKGKTIQLEARAPGYDDMLFVQETGFPKMEGIELNGDDGEEEEKPDVVLGEDAPESPPKKKRSMKIRPRLFFPAMIVVTFYVPGTNERMWNNDELNVVGRLDPDVFNQLKDIAMEMSGSSEEAAEEMEGNSASESTSG